MRYYFISDVHLGYGADRSADRDRERRLLTLLKRIEREAESGEALGLVLAGDIFDSWFEFKTVVPRRHVRTLASLAHIAERIPVEYLIGNHDFGHRDFFHSELGIATHGDDIVRQYHGKRFYLSHGDGKAANDRGYLILKRVLRNRFSLWAYGLIHPDLGIPFAERISHTSRAYTDERDALKKEDGLKQTAERLIETGEYDYVVMGHRHFPEIVTFSKGTYINLGDWLKSYTYGIFDKEGFRIELAADR